MSGDGHAVEWDLGWRPGVATLFQLPAVMYRRGGLGEPALPFFLSVLLILPKTAFHFVLFVCFVVWLFRLLGCSGCSIRRAQRAQLQSRRSRRDRPTFPFREIRAIRSFGCWAVPLCPSVAL